MKDTPKNKKQQATPHRKTQCRTVDTSNLKGLREAERLHVAGWTTYSVGLFIIKFYKRGA